MEETFDYFGARICIKEKYEDGDVDAKIFPDKGDLSFIRKRFSKEEYANTLERIKKGELELKAGDKR